MKVHFIDNDEGDWQNVYVDGKCVYSGHGMRAEDLAEYLVGENNVTSEERASDDDIFGSEDDLPTVPE